MLQRSAQCKNVNVVRTSDSIHDVFKQKIMQIGENNGKNGANMTRRVILTLQDSLLLCVIKKMINSRVNSCLYVHLPLSGKRGKNFF